MTDKVRELAKNIVNVFREMEPVKLEEMPAGEHGIYGLLDHHGRKGEIRYIGVAANRTLRKRVWGDHTQGTGPQNGNSHKLGSQVYNRGRLFRAYNDNSDNAKMSKKLRTAFCRKFCRAVFFTLEIPNTIVDGRARTKYLELIEEAVKREARSQGLDWFAWDTQGAVNVDDGEVDALIDKLLSDQPKYGDSNSLRAYEAQATLWRTQQVGRS